MLVSLIHFIKTKLTIIISAILTRTERQTMRNSRSSLKQPASEPIQQLRQLTPIIHQNTIKYKESHKNLPLLILPDFHILVFTNNPIYKKIYPYLISFAQPIYRPKIMHEYKITKFSLYTAMVLRYSALEIIQILKKLSKNEEFPKELEKQIYSYMKYAGRVKFSLIGNQYYFFMGEEVYEFIQEHVEMLGEIYVEGMDQIHLAELEKEDDILYVEKQDKEDDDFQENNPQDPHISQEKPKQKLLKCRVKQDYFSVTKQLIQNNIPIIQQYDFEVDKTTNSIKMQMINGVKLRYYQERALKNIFIDGIARSGIIILPCGAGKSLVAIQAIERIKKNTVIFCESQVSAQQWKNEILKWTTLDASKIIVFSPKTKKINPKKIEEASVFITTYAMVGMKRVIQNQYLLVSQKISWGVCIADQVHKLPAETFQRVLKKYKFHLKLGLTATPYREDNKIDNLFYMIGPKLFQENWLDLVNEGCLARPYCVQILCEMPQRFMEHYQKLSESELLHTANPTKFKVLQYLLKKHSYYSDKVLVFCDRPKILELYARKLKLPFIHGQTKEQERLKIYNIFKTTKDINVIFVSRVGDTAIDLPCANVGIQIGMHYKSRRQEIQRMGRIMRAKDSNNEEYNAFFYTLVSLNTKQVTYSRMRQKTLVDQGFSYQIILADQFNYKGIKIHELDEKQYLIKLLVEHEQGSMYENEVKNKNKRKAKLSEEELEEENSYYYEEDL